MHVGARIIARRSSGGPAMAVLQMMSVLHIPRCAPSCLSLSAKRSFHGTKSVPSARPNWLKLTPNSIHRQIRAESDVSKVRVRGFH